MRKLSEINEGLWSDGVKRSHNNIKRKEENVVQKMKEFCEWNLIDNFEIDEIDGEKYLNCRDTLTITTEDIEDGCLPFKFGKITGSFIVKSGCDRVLTSFYGFPYEVDGMFQLSDLPKIKTLEGFPKKIKTLLIPDEGWRFKSKVSSVSDIKKITVFQLPF